MKSDMELVAEIRAGNRKAFSELVLRHQRALLRLCLRFVRDLSAAEDIVQESFMKAYEKLHLFEGRASFKSWLFQIGVNTAKNRLRAQPPDAVSLDEVQFGVDDGTERRIARGDLSGRIRAEVARLPERQRLALTLRVYEDLSFAEIAQVMSCPYDTAKANYRHGLMRLKERLERLHGETDWADFEAESPLQTRDVLMEVES